MELGFCIMEFAHGLATGMMFCKSGADNDSVGCPVGIPDENEAGMVFPDGIPAENEARGRAR